MSAQFAIVTPKVVPILTSIASPRIVSGVRTDLSKGLLYVIFGRDYDHQGAFSVAYSRRNTDLPIQVLTNIKVSERHPKWKDVKNITFTYFPIHQKMNRTIKTSMIQYSNFDLTLYLDSDTVIQNKGIEKVFDLIGNNDLLLNLLGYFNFDGRPVGVADKCRLVTFKQKYLNMMALTKVSFPIRIYYGAFVGFRKTLKVLEFFETWSSFQKLDTRGMDMPALACAVKKSGIKVIETTTNGDKIFGTGKQRYPDAIVEHRLAGREGLKWFKDFGIPAFRPK